MNLKVLKASITNKDFRVFNEHIMWILASPEIKLKRVVKNVPIHFSELMTKSFPELTTLLKSARRTDIILEWYTLNLYCWDNNEKAVMGWVVMPQENKLEGVLEEHNLLLSELGSIKHSFNEPTNSILNKFTEFFHRSKTLKSLIEKGRFEIVIKSEGAKKTGDLMILNDFHTTKMIYFYSVSSSLVYRFEKYDLQNKAKKFREIEESNETFVSFIESMAKRWQIK